VTHLWSFPSPRMKPTCLTRTLLPLCLAALPWLAAPASEQPSGQNQAFPPAIAAWTEADFAPQRAAAVQLNKDLQAAILSGAKTFTIAPGDYRFHPQALPCLVIKDAHDLVIDGTGATFWLYPFQRLDGITLEHCRNVTVRGLTIDYYPATYPQGVVTAIDSIQGYIDFRLAPGFSTPMDVPGHLTNAKLEHFDQKGDFIETKLDWVREVQDLGGGSYRVYPKNGSAYHMQTAVAPGTVLALAGRTMRMVFNLHESDHCTLENITAYASPHMVFTEDGGEGGHSYLHCHVVLRPGTRRLLASNADVFHSMGVNHGPTIEGCEFSHSGDDLINIHGTFAMVYSQPAPDVLEVLNQVKPDFPANTTLQFFDFDSLAPAGQAKVLTTSAITEPAEIAAATQMITEKKLFLIRPLLVKVQLDHPISIPKYSLVAMDSRVASGTIIRGNFLHDAQARGTLLKSTNGLIENNHYDNIGMCSIGLANDAVCLEGPFATHMTVQNNIITRNGLISILSRNEYPYEIGAISVTMERTKGLSAAQSNFDVKILNNRIENSSNCGIFISNLHGGIVTGNTITDANSKEPLNMGRRMGLDNPSYGLVIVNSSNIDLERNLIQHPGQFSRGNIAFLQGVTLVGPQHP
jgi:hypothetical protein